MGHTLCDSTWALGIGQWAVGSGHWIGQWALGSGQWALGRWAVKNFEWSGRFAFGRIEAHTPSLFVDPSSPRQPTQHRSATVLSPACTRLSRTESKQAHTVRCRCLHRLPQLLPLLLAWAHGHWAVGIGHWPRADHWGARPVFADSVRCVHATAGPPPDLRVSCRSCTQGTGRLLSGCLPALSLHSHSPAPTLSLSAHLDSNHSLPPAVRGGGAGWQRSTTHRTEAD